MRWTTLVGLWCMAAMLVVAAVLWGPSLGIQQKHTETRRLIELEGFDLDTIDDMWLARGDDRWRFRREADGWWQVEPFRHRMHADLLLALPAAAMGTTVVDAGQPEQEIDRTVLGLDPPMASLMLIGEAGKVGIALGRRGMAGRAWAARDGADGLLVVDPSLHDVILGEHPSTWRDLRFFPGLSVDAIRLERTVRDETMVLQRQGRHWRITSPIETRADDAATAQHIVQLAGAVGEAVLLDHPEDASAFGLDPPVARVTVSGPGLDRTVLVGDAIAGSGQARYAMMEGVPSVVRMKPRDVRRLLGDPMSLVDKSGTDVAAMDVHRIDVQVGADRVLLERSLDHWVAPAHGGSVAAAGVVEGLMNVLTTPVATELMFVDRYPSDLEVAVMTLRGRQGAPLDSVRILREPLPPDGRGRWAMENGDRVLRILPEGTHLPLSAEAFGLPIASTQ